MGSGESVSSGSESGRSPEVNSINEVALRTLDSSQLLLGENEVLIRHGDDYYRLRLTRNGKLILQK